MQKSTIKNWEQNSWGDDQEIFIPNDTLQSFKQPLRQQKITKVQKTQRIKKSKKQEKPNHRQQTEIKLQVKAIQDQLIIESVQRLRNYRPSQSLQNIPIYKRLTRQRLLQFLERIEYEYSQTVKFYLATKTNQQSSSNLKKIFLKYIDYIVQVFPVLNNIVFQYAFRYYATGPLQYRFHKLMEKNITPILKMMSEKYNKNTNNIIEFEEINSQTTSTHISQSPQRQHLEQFQLEAAHKSQKKRRKKNKKMEEKKQQQTAYSQEQKIQNKVKNRNIQLDKSTIQLIQFLQKLQIDDSLRVQCRIQQMYTRKWKQKINENRSEKLLKKINNDPSLEKS